MACVQPRCLARCACGPSVVAHEGALLLQYHVHAAPKSAALVDQSHCAKVPCKWTRTSSKQLRLQILNSASKVVKTPAEEDWKVKRETLRKNMVRSVSAQEALRLQQEDGYIILDVRPAGDYKEAHAKGALNAEVFRLIKEWTPWDVLRRVGFAFFGIFAGTEENPNFLADVASQLDPSSKLIIACSSGGTMKPSQNLSEGQQSRSLIAAYILVLNGYKNVLHLEGGLNNWFKEDLPIEALE